jgi:hypothetical protein
MTHKCGDCGVEEGKLHELGCDVERCPKCGRQLISCFCFADDDGHWRDELYYENRIPHVEIPLLCALCGEHYPDFFMDNDWEKYVIPKLQEKILCLKCYNRMKNIFPNGWKKTK